MVFLQGHPEYLYGLVEAAGLVIERDVATWIANQGGWVSFFLGGGVVEVAVWLGDEAKIQWIRQEVVDGWVSLRKQLGWKDGRSPMVNGASGKKEDQRKQVLGDVWRGLEILSRLFLLSVNNTHWHWATILDNNNNWHWAKNNGVSRKKTTFAEPVKVKWEELCLWRRIIVRIALIIVSLW